MCVVMTLAALPAALHPGFAFATEYLTAAAAQAQMFPDATSFVPQTVALTAEQTRAIAGRGSATGFNPAAWSIVAAHSGDTLLGYVVIDNVIGKFEYITYAVAFAPDGRIRGVEILAYRESHGAEVRTRAWRNQFVGKTASAALTIDADIANISGATLSCTHLTDGVRRIATYVQSALRKS